MAQYVVSLSECSLSSTWGLLTITANSLDFKRRTLFAMFTLAMIMVMPGWLWLINTTKSLLVLSEEETDPQRSAVFKLGNITDFNPLVMARDKIDLQREVVEEWNWQWIFPTEGTFALDPPPPHVPCGRVCTCHGKPGKSWNLSISFSRPGKSWNLIVGPWRSWKIEVLFDSLVTVDGKARTM